jgi:hypothetical protein
LVDEQVILLVQFAFCWAFWSFSYFLKKQVYRNFVRKLMLGNMGVFHPWWLIYLVAFLFGVGQTTVLVTAISMEADLVGNDVKNSAFVYGFISCMEKLGTGTVIMSTSQYTKDLLTVRMVEIAVPFGGLIVSGIVLLTIVKYWKKQ